MDQRTFRSKTFPAHLARTFQDLLAEGHFTDVTLVSDDQIQIPAHKIVLSACSPVLKNLLLNNPHPNPLLYLRGCKQQELQSILQFMYLGEAAIHQDRINEFMEIAKDLEVKQVFKDDHPDGKVDTVLRVDSKHDKQIINVSNPEEEFHDDCIEPEPELQLKSEVSDGKSFSCKDCEIIFAYKRSYLRHCRSQHNSLKFSCNLCEYEANRKDSLKTHQKTKHEELNYFCDQCDYVASAQKDIRKHLQFSHEGIKYFCDHCVFYTDSISGLVKHKQASHEGKREKVLSRHKNLQHSESQLNIKGGPEEITKSIENTWTENEVSDKFICQVCESSFTKKIRFLSHCESEHDGIRFTCNECGYQAKAKDQIKNHKQYKHEGIKYSCDQCDHQAAHLGSLRIHQKAKHEGVRYSCKECEYKATNMSILKKHQQAKHTDMKYFCNQCAFYTAWPKNLYTHMKIKHFPSQ